jgi:predicted metal-dependent hydrolase
MSDEKWVKVVDQINRRQSKKGPSMTLEEAHEYESDLEKELKQKDSKNKALRFYGSTWDAIKAYQAALDRISKREWRLTEYRKEMSALSHKLDTYKISLPMWHEEVERLQRKYRVTNLFKEKSTKVPKGVSYV